jgi:hypothetical protein
MPDSAVLLNRHIHAVGGLKGCHMMELGNQQMMMWPPPIEEGSAAKLWFEQQGVAEHVSIDINGLLGAIPMDLSQPITKLEWQDAFDVTTDFGTSEHVPSLYECRANVHRFTRPGGLMVFKNPKTGHWPNHGHHYFTKRHYERLAEVCRYRVLEISEHPACNNFVDGWEICAVLQKRATADFISQPAFAQVCDQTVFTS